MLPFSDPYLLWRQARWRLSRDQATVVAADQSSNARNWAIPFIQREPRDCLRCEHKPDIVREGYVYII